MKLKKFSAASAGIQTSLDLDRIVFDGDRDTRAALFKDRDFAKAVSELAPEGETPSLAIRRSLLMTSVRLTPRLAPDLYACVKHCTDVLGITNEVEVYCSQEATMNAFIVPPQGNRLCIGFSNVALERFDDDELRFILGHELGHALFRHSEVPMHLAAGNAYVSPLNAMRLHAWSRYAELSCDRVGLICCGDFEVAARTFFKLTSGLSGPRWLRHVNQTALHYAAQEAADFGPGDEMDWFSTHPYSPLRVKALDLFARSRTYHRLVGGAGGSLSEAELEAQVTEIVELMNPSVLSEKVSCQAELKEFLALGGVVVARADGKVRRSELKAVAD
ncbi:MAG: M48 family peptidase, partial [Myxococcales bacterium]